MERRARARVVLIVTSFITAVVLTPVQSAFASCNFSHQNVEGYDASDGHDYGNRGDILVNDINYGQLNNSVHHSLFVWYTSDPQTGAFTNDAEVGWTANNGGFTQPHPYFEWVKNGADSGIRIDGSTTLTQGQDYNFKVSDSEGDGQWTGYLDNAFLDQTTNSINTPHGSPVTNSERRNTCDSMAAHFSSLNSCTSRSPCNWSNHYSDLHCLYTNTGGDWKFDKDSNSENHVRSSSGVTC